MKIAKMNTTSFWKGEVRVRGLVEDQAQSYEVSLYLKERQVRDYSCTCEKGNSYKGMCAHEEALFAYYEEYRSQASKPPVHTSSQVHTMIREYTNREVAKILAEEEAGQVTLAPVILLEGHAVRLELKVGKVSGSRLYVVKDLRAFRDAVEQGAYVEYGRELAFHHQKQAFEEGSRELLSFVLEMAESQNTARELEISRMNRDRLFELLERMPDLGIEVQLPTGIRSRLELVKEDPKPAIEINSFGRDGIQVQLAGVSGGRPVQASFRGERRLYLVSGSLLYRCSEEFTAAFCPFLEQMTKERDQCVYVGEKDIPLFYERVVKALQPYCSIAAGEVELEAYRPMPLKAEFRFDAGNEGELYMEPVLSYGDHSFHPVEDENLPRTICRDVPGEFRISQIINKYFKYKTADGNRLVIKGDEDGLFRLLDSGLEAFRAVGEVYLSEGMKKWKVLPTPKVSVGVGLSAGWLDLTVDTGDLGGQELPAILAAYREKKKYYRLKDGQFVMLGEGGLFTVMDLAQQLGVGKKELLSGHIRLPAYRALYLDSALKEGTGVAYYREQLFKAVVRGMKSVEDSSYPVPASMSEVLREYQKTGFRWLKTLEQCGFGGILADDMGLGKTIQVIALLEDAYENGEMLPSLIVCPASLVFNWEHEVRRFVPGRRVLSLVGNGGQREELLQALKEKPGEFEIIVTSYDLLKRDIALYAGMEFRFQIIDEAQYIKNAATQSAKAVKSVRARARFALTGTPVENHLGELWSIFDFLMPGFLFGSQFFRKEYEAPIVKDGDKERLERLRRLIAPFVLRRVKRDVLKELPDKLEQVVYSGFGEEQRALYAANALVLKEKLENGSLGTAGSEKLQILSELMRLRQLCCDPRLCYGNYKGESAKLETCMDLLKRGVEGGHRILLFSQFTSMLELIEKRLKKEGIASIKLTGTTPKEQRMEMVSEFHQGGIPVFLISLKAGGTGLNLTEADIVIHYDPWWNVAAQNQATDRTHRIGQEKQVTVYKLIAKNTIEENILRLQDMKQELAEQVVTEGNVSLASLSREDILEMLS